MMQDIDSRAGESGAPGKAEGVGVHRSRLPARAVLTLLLAVLSLGTGVFLRVVRWSEWPPGPWVDEAYALRAARVAAASSQPLFGTSPLTPLDEGFVNYYNSNVYLLLTAWVDRVCGGGLLTLRVLSIGPSLLLLLASSLLAWQLLRTRRMAFLSCVLWLSTSVWLLTTARWGWVAVSTAAFLVISAWTLTVALEGRGSSWSIASGVALGLAQYGYIAAWLTMAVPLVLAVAYLAGWRGTRGNPLWKVPALSFFTAFLVAAPLGIHFVKNPERAFARTQEVSITRFGKQELPVLLARNVVRYAGLFLWGGDPNERHGNPGSPVLPLLIAGLALAGAARAFFTDHLARCTALFSFFLLAGGIVSYDPGGANSFRISPSAPFFIVLAGVGLMSVLEHIPRKRANLITAVVGAAVLATATSDVSRFVKWTASARLSGVFGGPERELADALMALSKQGNVTLAMEPHAVRNCFVVETLVAPGGSAGPPSVRLVFPKSPAAWRYIPAGRQVLALSNQPDRSQFAMSLGARPLWSGGMIEGFPGFTIYEISPDESDAIARRVLSTYRLPALSSGSFEARERGIYELKAKGPGRLLIDGHPLPCGHEWAQSLVFLERGPHELTWLPASPEARLIVVAPHGYAVPVGG